MIADLRNIFFLVSDCIQLNHPIVLDIRYLFTETLGYFLSVDSQRTREEWGQLVTSEYKGEPNYQWTFTSFIKILLIRKIYRKRVVSVLEYERDKLLSFHIDKEEYNKWEI